MRTHGKCVDGMYCYEYEIRVHNMRVCAADLFPQKPQNSGSFWSGVVCPSYRVCLFVSSTHTHALSHTHKPKKSTTTTTQMTTQMHVPLFIRSTLPKSHILDYSTDICVYIYICMHTHPISPAPGSPIASSSGMHARLTQSKLLSPAQRACASLAPE